MLLAASHPTISIGRFSRLFNIKLLEDNTVMPSDNTVMPSVICLRKSLMQSV